MLSAHRYGKRKETEELQRRESFVRQATQVADWYDLKPGITGILCIERPAFGILNRKRPENEEAVGQCIFQF